MLYKRIIYASIGLLFTGIAIVGVWVPGLPTTVFLLVALWAFSNSSDKLHKWLMNIPILKTALKQALIYKQQKAVTKSTKIISQSFAYASVILVFVVTHNLIITGLVLAAAIVCSIFMIRTRVLVK